MMSPPTTRNAVEPSNSAIVRRPATSLAERARRRSPGRTRCKWRGGGGAAARPGRAGPPPRDGARLADGRAPLEQRGDLGRGLTDRHHTGERGCSGAERRQVDALRQPPGDKDPAALAPTLMARRTHINTLA